MDTNPPESSLVPPTNSPPPPLPPPALFSPLEEGQRSNLIDALRGFAIFGIFLVNMSGFKAPMLATAGTGARWMEGEANAATILTIEVLASGKFISIFALLFGMGMVMQEQRVHASGPKFTPFFLRRMFVLLFLGIAHGVLLWAGDVLAFYALFGMIGLLFFRCRAKILLMWATALFAVVLLMLMGLGALTALDDGSGDVWWAEMGEWWVEVYQTGTLGEIFVGRLAEWGLMWAFGLLTFIPYAFVLFLLGMALGKINILDKLPLWQSRLRLLVAMAIPMGLVSTFYYAGVFYGPLATGIGTAALGMGGYVTGMILLALAYAVLFSFFVQSNLAPTLVKGLASVGRLALTNYILQSFIANVIFMSWGFGLYGKVEAPAGVLIVLIVFICQLIFSHLWLQKFRIGPIEWVWRALSYGSAPRLRR